MSRTRKLLLADDSVAIQKVIDLTFTDEGFAVTITGDGNQALEKLAEVMPDIVLADVFMPGKNGYEVCEQIKLDERFRHIPVILLVGSFEPFKETEARRVGADDVLTKPFQSIRQLVNKVGALISGETKNAAEEERALATPLDSVATDHSVTSAAPHSPAAATFTPLDYAAPDGAFADAAMDDTLIEATSAENFAGHQAASRQTVPLSPAEAPEVAQALRAADTKPLREVALDGRNFGAGDEPLPPFASTEKDAKVYAEGRHIETFMNDAQSKSSSHMADATAADDALLDLGDLAPHSSAATEADDFILDLRDEFAAASTAPATFGATENGDAHETASAVEFEEAMTGASPQSAAYTEAQSIGEAERAAYASTEEQFATVSETEEAAEFSTHFAPEPTAHTEESYQTPVADQEAFAPHTDEMPSVQLSPEAIDQIARRVVEQLSERIVQEIAWEVVPQLAELMIKRRLEEEKT